MIDITTTLFIIFASISFIGFLGVLVLNNIVRQIISMLYSVFFIALILILLNATYVGAITVLVYSGAILVLYLFAVMLLNPKKELKSSKKSTVIAIIVTTITMVGALFAIIYGGLTRNSLVIQPRKTLEEIGETLVQKAILAFEGISILLLIAMIGAIVIASQNRSQTDYDLKKKDGSKKNEADKEIE